MTQLALRWDVNPIWQKSFRARLRPRHLLSWGVVTVTVTAFVSLITYTTITQRHLAPMQDAAKAVLPALIIIQSILLMMFGTGAVAAGISSEREEGLADYQRMTPMSPASKILGYLFGLPVREYVLFAMTMPFVIVAVIISKFDVLTLVHFYLVFFTSVLVYHMTGLAAGMVSPKPRLASMVSMGLVAALYFVLPNLSRIGITFFEFLTIRPTFFGLVQQQLPEDLRAAAEQSGIDTFRDVPFFTTLMHPTAYTLLVQGFMIAVLFQIIRRKWKDPSSHVLSKGGGLFVFGGVLFFVLASIWAVISQEDAYRQVFALMDRGLNRYHRSPETLELLLFMSSMIIGATYLLVVATITPSRHTVLEGWRRARKLGRRTPAPNSDAASSLPASLVMIAASIAGGIAIVWLAGRGGEYYEHGPSVSSIVILVAGLVGTALFVQGLRERTSLRVFGVAAFVLWMIPFFTMMILFAAFASYTAGSYAGLACPPVAVGFGIANMLDSTTMLPGVEAAFLPAEMDVDGPRIAMAGAIGYAIAGGAMQWSRRRAWRQMRRAGLDAA